MDTILQEPKRVLPYAGPKTGARRGRRWLLLGGAAAAVAVALAVGLGVRARSVARERAAAEMRAAEMAEQDYREARRAFDLTAKEVHGEMTSDERRELDLLNQREAARDVERARRGE